MARACVEYCGESYPVGPEGLTIGRDADLVLDDDNPYLHRRLLEVLAHDDLVWLRNLGTRISVTVADDAGMAQTLLAPGARVPLVFPRTVAWFTAGPSTYDVQIVVEDPPFAPAPDLGGAPVSSRATIGQVRLTPDQHLLILALAEPILRRGRGVGSIPASQAAATRLGWTITKFNRKLDSVCEKLTRAGVRGLLGTSDRLASNRRVRLVEYALASRLITADDLSLLDLPPRPSGHGEE